MIKIWDEARYLDEAKRTKKALTPLSRFRVRKRYPPPSTICSNGVRKTNTLPREATSCLKLWLMNHFNDPYPSANEKQQLAKISGLSHAQVKTWFANARRRSKTTEEFQRRCRNHWSVPISECKFQMICSHFYFIFFNFFSLFRFKHIIVKVKVSLKFPIKITLIKTNRKYRSDNVTALTIPEYLEA